MLVAEGESAPQSVFTVAPAWDCTENGHGHYDVDIVDDNFNNINNGIYYLAILTHDNHLRAAGIHLELLHL